jgi:hypothetical protein
MHMDCPGYCDPLDQNFRDESESVIKRAQKSYRMLNGSTKENVSKWPEDAIDLASTITTWMPMFYGLAPEYTEFPMPVHRAEPIDDIAISHFMSSYIPGSHFDYLPSMYDRLAKNTALPSTIYAASIATLARSSGQARLMDMARRSYVRALLKTNAALADPLTASEDSTLVSVLLLSLFEAIAWSGSRTPDSWTTHTRGALALIKLRGRQQFETPVGRQLFVQVVNIISINSLQRKTRLPKELMDLLAAAMEYQSECPKYQLACLTGDVSALVADIDEGGRTAEEIISATLDLEDRYVAYADNLVSPWRYREIMIDVCRPDVHGNMVHQYASHRAAGLWNSYRMTRILFNEIIHAYSSCMPSDIASILQQKAVVNIEEMTTDICASIPQFVNPAEFAMDLDLHFPCSQHTSSFPHITSLSPKRSAASLLWPLAVVCSAHVASVEVKAYARERMAYLGREFHLPQAGKVTIDDCEYSALQDGLHMYYVS